MSEVSFLYVTTPSPECAKKISNFLLEEKLISCANIIPGMTSIYRWKGQVETENETVIILKTSVSLVTVVEEKIKAIHPNEIPCIAQINLDSINSAYKNWLLDNLKK